MTKLGCLTEIDWKYVGALLAAQESGKQIDFFKQFVAECRSWGTSYQIGIQMAYISSGLSSEEKEILSQITEKEAS